VRTTCRILNPLRYHNFKDFPRNNCDKKRGQGNYPDDRDQPTRLHHQCQSTLQKKFFLNCWWK